MVRKEFMTEKQRKHETERMRQWRAKNADHYRDYQREYRRKYRERLRTAHGDAYEKTEGDPK